ncbi:MAG: acyltransferase, partial [Pyrinomonadaceae bacterium]
GMRDNPLTRWLTSFLREFVKDAISQYPIPEGIQVGEGCKIESGAEFRGFYGGIRLGKKVTISRHAYLHCYDDSSTLEIGDRGIVMPYAMLMTHPGGRIRLGNDCSVNPFTVLYGHGGLEIGSDVRIAAHTVIIPANHVFTDPEVPIRLQGLTKQGIVIGDNVWIGANCVILDGCHIGSGSVIAAGTVLSTSVPPTSVVGGVPGRVIKRRTHDS